MHPAPRFQIRGTSYFRLAAFAPFILPIALLAIALPFQLIGVPGANGVVGLSAVLLAAALLGGLPYLLTAAFAFWKLRHASAAAHARAAWWLPLPYALVLGAVYLAFALGEGGSTPASSLGFAAAWGACGLGFGYAYVLLAQTLYKRLLRSGLVSGEDGG